MYGKFVNNELQFAPSVLYNNGCTICNPTEAMLREHGYKEVVFTESPEVPAGYYTQFRWVESDDAITQSWELVEQPASAELSPEDALSIILAGA